MLNVDQKNKFRSVAILMLLSIFLIELIRTSWLSDDSLITARVVLNTIHGYGPVFNLGERVQAYTHPLWFLLLVFVTLIVGNIYVAMFGLSILVSLLTLWFLLRRVATIDMLALPIVLLVSKAYVDFSTSGLEGPLTHLLLIVGFSCLIDKSNYRFTANLGMLLLGSVYLSRPDAMLLVLPFVFYKIGFGQEVTKRQRITQLILFVLPGILWTCFSIIYYGFPFANTAYAKLNTGISKNSLAAQGLLYVFDSIAEDPVTLLTVIVSLGLSILFIRLTKDQLQKRMIAMVAVGMVLHILYIISIGGDFMSGRFFTPVFVVAVFLIQTILISSKFDSLQRSMMIAPLLVIGLFEFTKVFNAYPKTVCVGNCKQHGIFDERAYYREYNTLITYRERYRKPDWTLTQRNIVDICGGLGAAGVNEGPANFLIDNCALTDPLLARLPMRKSTDQWRIGHFHRRLPFGYRRSVEENENLIIDQDLHDFYGYIRTITRDQLFSYDRWSAIVRINLGFIPINKERYRLGLESMQDGAEVLPIESYWLPFIDDFSVAPKNFLELTKPLSLQMNDQRRIKMMALNLQGVGTVAVDVLIDDEQFKRVGRIHVNSNQPQFYKLDIEPIVTQRVRLTQMQPNYTSQNPIQFYSISVETDE